MTDANFSNGSILNRRDSPKLSETLLLGKNVGEWGLGSRAVGQYTASRSVRDGVGSTSITPTVLSCDDGSLTRELGPTRQHGRFEFFNGLAKPLLERIVQRHLARHIRDERVGALLEQHVQDLQVAAVYAESTG